MPKSKPKTYTPPTPAPLAAAPVYPGRMSTKLAAAYLGVSVHALEKRRYLNQGPPYSIPPGSRPIYLKEDIDAWLAAHRVEVA